MTHWILLFLTPFCVHALFLSTIGLILINHTTAALVTPFKGRIIIWWSWSELFCFLQKPSALLCNPNERNNINTESHGYWCTGVSRSQSASFYCVIAGVTWDTGDTDATGVWWLCWKWLIYRDQSRDEKTLSFSVVLLWGKILCCCSINCHSVLTISFNGEPRLFEMNPWTPNNQNKYNGIATNIKPYQVCNHKCVFSFSNPLILRCLDMTALLL